MSTKKSAKKAAPKKTTKAKPASTKGTKKAAKPRSSSDKLSQIDAALKVLKEAGEPMNCVTMVEAMAAKGYWETPGGKTPHATLYSAILREISRNGKEARFVKTERGKFELAK